MTAIANRFKSIYHEFPRQFWPVVIVGFIDRIGGTLLFPFFALYITGKFNVGMTEAGVVLGIFSIAGLFGGMIGGALTDRWGRKKLILFGLVFSAVSTLTLGSVNQFAMLIPLAVMIGLLSDIAGPAHGAMIADILPEDKRNEGFGILRVTGNLAWIIGPTIGGIIAQRSFFTLFVIDACISLLVALLVLRFIPETKPETPEGTAEQHESIFTTFKGYLRVLRDGAFMAFLVASVLMGLVYSQMYSSLSVYLRDNHGIDPQGYGFIMTSSAIVVILLQFWVSRQIKTRPPFALMALGVLFYMVGFTMFGFVTAYWLFVAAIVIVTFGEMIIMPTSQTLAANFAPEALRGRYMAAFGLTFYLPTAVAPFLAGLILDNLNPNLLWYAGGVLCALSAVGFYALHLTIGREKRFASRSPQPEAAPAD